jgi:hypothetical protein
MARNGWCSADDKDEYRVDSECAYGMGGRQRRRCDGESAGRRVDMRRRARRAEVLSRDCTGRKHNVVGVAVAEVNVVQCNVQCDATQQTEQSGPVQQSRV